MSVVRNPFAAAPPQGAGGPPGGAGGRGGDQNSPTGPILGKGSELSRLWSMPDTMGHSDGINCMVLVEDRIYTGGRDGNLFIWRGNQTPQGGFELVQDAPPIALNDSVTSLHYDPASKWLFCGLWGGTVVAYCKDPMAEERLTGHRRSVASIALHSGVLISGSNDGTVRLWTRPQGRWQMHGQPLNNPSGAVTVVKVVNNALWVAAQNGITCFDLETLNARGTIAANFQVTGLLDCDGYCLATYRNGDIKVFDGTGNETFNFPSRGEHTSNTAVGLMTHPVANKPMLMCGQQFGYVTAYDLPDFKPRGSFVCKTNSDVKAILDVKFGGLFLTGGVHGDIMVWQWGQPSAGAATTSPFVQAAAAQNAQGAFGVPPNGGMMG
mmetsp:Transcript_17144/g.36806  ORF Transcript_17144/g.36806 Transcript_17144/m.36806 type:complete len:380 (+) Transcript_17144:171-1310(+)|eukprot:CAMPEP_0194748300 /NCGR_PEP_ID=MMETSP0323_2-20130528/2446_1 /TAXON_ID=2866 ORGANISM="Crypthecodinium cohnii, Strain Seligo" /NCGR_SAMPLE_ID=MMETSP0323_2 /ASSEMBLY_ACC=CAM_ASM_000346 /LENGTH=379 /DNA_ID=CAMNT_0039662431 /DNA_START=18 /DNA_END=1157 /DNA_ORIENTATION=-